MQLVSSLTPLNHRSLGETTSHHLSNLFSLKGNWVRVALKVSALALLCPLTLPLFAIHVALRYRYRVTVQTTPISLPVTPSISATPGHQQSPSIAVQSATINHSNQLPLTPLVQKPALKDDITQKPESSKADFKTLAMNYLSTNKRSELTDLLKSEEMQNYLHEEDDFLVDLSVKTFNANHLQAFLLLFSHRRFSLLSQAQLLPIVNAATQGADRTIIDPSAKPMGPPSDWIFDYLLIKAAESGYIDLLEALKFDPRFYRLNIDFLFLDILRTAAKGGHTPIVEFLKSQPASDRISLSSVNFFLNKAAREGHIYLFEALKSYSQFDNLPTIFFMELLKCAAENGHSHIIEFLKSHPQFDKLPAFGLFYSLLPAAENGHGHIIEALRPHLNFRSIAAEDLGCILQRVLEKNHFHIFEALKSHPQFNTIHIANLTNLLIAASASGYISALEALKLCREYTNLSTEGLIKILVSAATNGHLLIIENLRSHPRFSSIRGGDGRALFETPMGLVNILEAAAKNGHIYIFEALRRNNPEFDNISDRGLIEILSAAAKGDHVNVLEDLRTHRNFSNISSIGLIIILECAASSGKVMIPKALRSHRNFKSISPGMLSYILNAGAKNGHINILEALHLHPNINDESVRKTLLKICKQLHPNLTTSSKMPLSRQIALGRKKTLRK